jgi:hypothetical protein
MPLRSLFLLLFASLAMSVGWGFRGDYGHEAGAMVPGALIALAICIASGRSDWWERGSLLAMVGAIGWAFGGQVSYGKVVGYTGHTSFPDVAYGFACLFLIGAIWGSLGAGLLGFGVTKPRSELERFAGPLIVIYLGWQALAFTGYGKSMSQQVTSRYPILSDSDWLSAALAVAFAILYALPFRRARKACFFIAGLGLSWLISYLLLRGLLGLRMTPPRSDNWAGAVGLVVFLALYCWRTRNRVALMLTSYGFLAGGVGFAVGDFIQMLGRAQWGPIGTYPMLQKLDYWKWMEQSFGLMMGFGVALGFLRLLRGGIAPVENDEPNGLFRWLAPFFLLVVMMWENLGKNVREWKKSGAINEALFGVTAEGWFLIVGIAFSLGIMIALIKFRRGGLALVPSSAFGRAQLLFLMILWIAVVGAFAQAFPSIQRKGTLLVHVSFWLTACLCTYFTILASDRPVPVSESTSNDDLCWRLGWKHCLFWLAIPLLIWLLAFAITSTHENPLPGSHLRFEG